jgi:hypothetical protein
MFNDHPSSSMPAGCISRQISFLTTQAKRVPKYLIFSYIGSVRVQRAIFNNIIVDFAKIAICLLN